MVIVDNKKPEAAGTAAEMSHMSQNSQISCPSEGPETSKPYTLDHDSIREPFK